ncbi:MAG: hypothetical protein E6K98_05175 [Thaumarchaeota archaeon]|nr:MAG: hypothetical protein E6K98_05175 [Nitrososphaerota archaeon]
MCQIYTSAKVARLVRCDSCRRLLLYYNAKRKRNS